MYKDEKDILNDTSGDQGKVEDLLNNTSAAEDAQRRVDEARELEEAALQKAASRKSDGDISGTDDTLISEADLSFLKTK